MVSTDKVLFSLQMAEESLQEVHLLQKDRKIRSLLNSLYNLYHYGMESLLLSRDIHSRSHDQLRENFIKVILKSDPGFPPSLEEELSALYRMKRENEKGKAFTPAEVKNWVEKGETFLNQVKKKVLV